MSEEVKPQNQMRKSTKYGIGVGAILLAIQPLREAKEFFTGDQVVTSQRLEATMKDGFERMERQLNKHIDEEVIVHRRIRDLGREELSASELRCEGRADRVERRVENLELFAFKVRAPGRGG